MFGLTAMLAPTTPHAEDPLLKALSQSKHALVDGVQQVSKSSEVAISAKFEMEDGKLSLSVYTAERGLSVQAEKNVLKEFAGDPIADAWKPEVEVFKDVEHVSRSAEQLTLMALSPTSLVDIARKATKDHPGTVYSITPMVRDRKAVFAVLVADKEKSVELAYDLMTGETSKATPAGYSKK
jgi:hypothetical protein